MTLDGRMIWTDIETFGLKPEECPVLEVGFIITDLDLIEIDRWDIKIWDTPSYELMVQEMLRDSAYDESARYVLNMHTKNSLLKECQEEGFTVAEAEQEIVCWLESHGVQNESMCGSSVDFDRTFINYWFPKAGAKFHYRVVDVSSFKTWIAAKFPAHYTELAEGRGTHRALPDIEDTIAEFKFYNDHFIGLLDVLSGKENMDA